MSEENPEVFSKDTFLTSLRNGVAQNADATTTAKTMVEEPAGMALVREKHAQLHEVVGSLSEKITAVLGRQEKDFLAAYRAHMYNVQKELHDLREKMHRNETVENKTEKIKKIEEERDWYRKEALRLDAFTTSMTKDLKYMREKLESIEEDRNWLEKQLKACKKQNKLLRAELDVRVTTGGMANGNPFDGTTQLPGFDSPKANGAALARRLTTKILKADETDENGGTRSSCLPSLLGDPAGSSTLVEEREEKFRKQIRSLKKELQMKNGEITALRRQRVAPTEDVDEKSQLECLFLQCVESVKEDITRRKVNPHGDKKGKDRVQGGHRGVSSIMADKTRNQNADQQQQSEFSSADRVRVIEKLLAHDEVLTLLYEQLFPAGEQRPAVGAAAANAQRPTTTDGESRGGTSAIQGSDSTKSLPDAATSPSNRRVNFENVDGSRTTTNSPAGSGVSAVRGSGSGSGLGLPIDDSTRNYLRNMRLGSSS